MSWFYEDESSWTRTVADVCSAVVNYGVELPWCVCAKSSNVIIAASDAVVSNVAALGAYTGADQWWTVEHSVMLFWLLFAPQLMWRKNKGDKFAFAGMMLHSLGIICFFFSYANTIMGLQGGIVYGGKLFYPTIFVIALFIQGVGLTLRLFNGQAFGHGALADPDPRDPKYVRTFNFMIETTFNKVMALNCIATYGLPKIEPNADLMRWLCVVPFLVDCLAAEEYHFPKPADCTDSNGEVPKAEEKKAEPAKAAEPAPAAAPAKAEEKKDAAAAPAAAAGAESPTAETETKPSLLCGLKTRLCGATGSACRAAACVRDRVQALPWACITKLAVTLAMAAIQWSVVYTLTEDCLAIVFPLLKFGAPLLLDRYSAKLGADWDNLLREEVRFVPLALQYYLARTYIQQA